MTPCIAFQPAAEADFETLLALRIRVLRPHLERVGRFDPERARRYFREGYDPGHLRLILVAGAFAGCVALKPAADGLELENFYRSEERRVGKECGRKWRSRWTPLQYKKKRKKKEK